MASDFSYMPDRQGELIPMEKWVRVFFGGQAIADSRRVKLLRSTERTPVYFFPPDDVRREALTPSAHTSHSDVLGQSTYWNIQAGGRRAENAGGVFAAA